MSTSTSNTIAGQWQAFETRTMPPGAGDVQRLETRRAFYAGIQGLMNIMRHNISHDPKITDADGDLLEKLDAELKQFVADVLAGKA